MKTGLFLGASVTTLKNILKVDHVDYYVIGEMEVFDGVKKYFDKNSDKSKHFRNLMKPIRFTTMKNHDNELVKCFNKCSYYLRYTEIF